MNLIVVSDIFGRTVEFEQLISQISPYFGKTEIVDPYGGASIDFLSEQEAYSYFQHHVGLQCYAETVRQAKPPSNEITLFVGFSVGASAIWAISNERFHKMTKAICFYGSQIRNQLAITPTIGIDLYFPKYEKHFNVTDLISKLSVTQHLNCFQTQYYHGFMNKKSVNYDESGCKHYIEIIKNADNQIATIHQKQSQK